MQTTASSSDYLFILSIDVFPINPDWSVIIADMKEMGLSYSRQARAIGKEQSGVQCYYQEGVPPRFPEAHALLILHSKICGIELTRKRLEEAKETG